jgi:uncharacterized protein (TIGR00725 family)
MSTPLSKTTIGVMGSGSDEHRALAEPLGRLLARLGVNLLTGAGGGVMTSVSRAFTQEPRRAGISIGIVPCASMDSRAVKKSGYPNAFVELPIVTHLPHSGAQGDHDLSRNHINVLSCAAIVALPGGAGAASEVALAERYDKPIVVFATDESTVAHFSKRAPRVSTIEDVEAFLRAHIQGPA